jgi:hypothetical protein
LGSGAFGAIQRLETGYDGQGNAYLLTSYDAATSGTIVNQVQRAFNGLGQMTTEWQSHSGAVNTSTTPKVQYAYSEMASGANHSRLTNMTYPNGRVITYDYGSGLNNNISRLNAIKDGSTTLESYDYLGHGAYVGVNHPETGVDLSYIKLSGESVGDAGDQYTGLDRFGRVYDQRYRNGSTDKDRYLYGYDRNSNRLYKENILSSALSELYSYDGINQISSFDRGTLNGSKNAITGTASRTQDWTFDALGNWSALDTNGTSTSRTHNNQNELTAVGSNSLTYDSNGNMTTDETGKQFVWDAWNRLVAVKSSSGILLESYHYDARGYRISDVPNGGSTKDLYYTANWQLIEERISGTTRMSYVWSPVYIDSMVSRDRDTDNNGSLEERLYPTHDANFNVTGLINTSGTVLERYNYDTFGSQTLKDGGWSTIGSSTYGWAHGHQGLMNVATAELHYNRARWYDVIRGGLRAMIRLNIAQVAKIFILYAVICL